MTASRRSPGRILAFAAMAAASVVAIVGCGSSPAPVPPASAPLTSGAATSPAPSTAPSVAATAEPSLTPVPGAPSASPVALPSTTNTEFGKVWDALPASWPELPGESESEIGTDASAMLVVKGQPVALAKQLGTLLKARGWSVDIGSPLEDGSVVVDATRDPAGCKAEARFTSDGPGSDTGTLLVYYGATCPFI